MAARHPGRVRTLTVVSTPHPLALRQALLGDDPAQAAHGAATDSFRAPEVPERLLLGPDGAGAGLATVLAESGLDDGGRPEYVAALAEPGALTGRAQLVPGHGRRGVARPAAGGGAHALRLVDRRRGVRPDGRGGDGGMGAGPYTFEVLENVSHWVPEMAPDELSDLLLRPPRGRTSAAGPPERRGWAVCENGRMSDSTFALTDDQRQFRDTMRAFADERVAPHAAEADRTAEYPWKSFEACREMELPALGIPEAYGGAGADT